MNITQVMEVKANKNIPALTSGDTVKVRVRIVEGEKSRIQPFQGVVIRVRHGGAGASFTVRRVTYGIGVERTFPIYSPQVESVDIIRHGKVRRSRLYYLRGLSTKASRIKERRVEKVLVPEEGQPVEQAQAAEAEAQAAAAAAAQAPAQPQAEPQAQTPAAPSTASAEQPKAEAKSAPKAEAKTQPEAQAKEAPKGKSETKAQPAPAEQPPSQDKPKS